MFIEHKLEAKNSSCLWGTKATKYDLHPDALQGTPTNVWYNLAHWGVLWQLWVEDVIRNRDSSNYLWRRRASRSHDTAYPRILVLVGFTKGRHFDSMEVKQSLGGTWLLLPRPYQAHYTSAWLPQAFEMKLLFRTVYGEALRWHFMSAIMIGFHSSDGGSRIYSW